MKKKDNSATNCTDDTNKTDKSMLFYCRNFKTFLDIFQKTIYRDAVKKGWHQEDCDDLVAFALIHSEVSEAVEASRHGNPPSEHIPEFSGIEEELADIVIRVMDHAEKRGHRLSEAIIAKIDFNRNREHKHGGKRV